METKRIVTIIGNKFCSKCKELKREMEKSYTDRYQIKYVNISDIREEKIYQRIKEKNIKSLPVLFFEDNEPYSGSSTELLSLL